MTSGNESSKKTQDVPYTSKEKQTLLDSIRTKVEKRLRKSNTTPRMTIGICDAFEKTSEDTDFYMIGKEDVSYEYLSAIAVDFCTRNEVDFKYTINAVALNWPDPNSEESRHGSALIFGTLAKELANRTGGHFIAVH